jgi:hypothetical protein
MDSVENQIPDEGRGGLQGRVMKYTPIEKLGSGNAWQVDVP